MFYVYVIRSVSHPKRYYIGFTENIDQRIKEHNEGNPSKRRSKPG
jgi:predicted GIY-YIG superfamily endonuclease